MSSSSATSVIGSTTNIASNVFTLPTAPAAGQTYTISPFQLSQGTVFNCPAQGAGVLTIAIPVPSAAQGLTVKIVLTAAPGGNNVVVNGAGATILCAGQSSAGWSVPTAGRTTINFVTGTALAGDRIELTSNGVIWFGNTITSAAAAAITYAP
jgi:hypothetical protein